MTYGPARAERNPSFSSQWLGSESTNLSDSPQTSRPTEAKAKRVGAQNTESPKMPDHHDETLPLFTEAQRGLATCLGSHRESKDEDTELGLRDQQETLLMRT